MDELITIRDAAERFAVSEKTVRRWISEGKVEAYRCGGRLIRIDAHSLYMMREPVQFMGY